MKIERKFHKGAQFDKRSNAAFLLRVDDLKKVKNWIDEDFENAIQMLNTCKSDIDRQIKHMNEVREKNKQNEIKSGHK